MPSITEYCTVKEVPAELIINCEPPGKRMTIKEIIQMFLSESIDKMTNEELGAYVREEYGNRC